MVWKWDIFSHRRDQAYIRICELLWYLTFSLVPSNSHGDHTLWNIACIFHEHDILLDSSMFPDPSTGGNQSSIVFESIAWYIAPASLHEQVAATWTGRCFFRSSFMWFFSSKSSFDHKYREKYKNATEITKYGSPGNSSIWSRQLVVKTSPQHLCQASHVVSTFLG